jgi:anti-sigma B factor antagonist
MTAPPDQPPAAMLRLSGDIDLATADDVVMRGANLLTHSQSGVPLIVDLGEVTFLDSSGLSALVRLRRAAEAQGCQVLLRDVPDRVAALLELSGLAEYFPERIDLPAGPALRSTLVVLRRRSPGPMLVVFALLPGGRSVVRSARLKILSGEFMGRRLAFVLLVVLSLVSIALPAGAVTNGTYDGNNHPYVGYADNLSRVWARCYRRR